MYKRKVRILFLDDANAIAAFACAYANAIGAQWLEAKSATTAQHAAVPAHIEQLAAEQGLPLVACAALAATHLAWADLVITLGQTRAPTLPPQAQTRHWPMPTAIDTRDDVDGVTQEIKRRVEGVIGGIRLLAKSDDERG